MCPAPVPPSPWKKVGNTLEPVSAVVTSIKVGSTNTTEGSEVTIALHQIENDAGETITAYKKTIELDDETDSTEDIIIREYVMAGGTLGMIYSSKVYTAEPTGTEAPVLGCRVLADRATWDPASKGSGGAYWVWWDGDSFTSIDAQAA